jgi:catechol 2,3-dioxygenase-like lactoylglutathione lyase family enzyme
MKYWATFLFLLYLSSSNAQTEPADSLSPDVVGIIAKDIDRVSIWYVEFLGFKIIKKLDLPQYDSLKINFLKKETFMLEVVGKRKAFSIKDYIPGYQSFSDPLLQGFNKISFRVNNIKERYQTFQAKNVIIKAPLFDDKNFKLWTFIAEDPEGNLIQFVQYY